MKQRIQRALDLLWWNTDGQSSGGPRITYFTTVLMWVGVGMLVGVTIAMGSERDWGMAGFLAGMAALLATSIYKTDKSFGYVDALHAQVVKNHASRKARVAVRLGKGDSAIA
jgi:hypothetical protein